MNTDIYFDNYLKYTIKEFYLNSIGDTKPNYIVVNYLNQIFNRLNLGSYDYYRGVFENALVETYNMGRYDSYDAMNYYGTQPAAYTNGKSIRFNSKYFSANSLSHEMGHLYNFSWRNGSKIGEQLWQFYKDIRQQDFTINTPELERFAEDFKSLYGSDEVVGKLSANDDGKRKPQDITNYWLFMKSLYPVAKRLEDGRYQNIQIVNNILMWQRDDVWECFSGSGNFYYWKNGVWSLY